MDKIMNPKARIVFGEIRRQKNITKFELAKNTSLKTTTLTRILEELLEERLIIEAGHGSSKGGRKPILYSLNPEFAYILGLDLSRTYSKIVLCDFHLHVVDSVRWEMTEFMTPSILLKHVVHSVEQLLTQNHIAKNDIFGMGIGSVGPLDRINGIMMEPLHFPAAGWKNVNIREILEAELPFPIKVDNGANSALLGEYWLGESNHDQQMIYVHVGIGLRSSLMSAEKVLYGAWDMEGSIGQMVIQTDGVPPLQGHCGNYGALESYTTIQALERKAKSLLKQGRESILNHLVTNVEEINFNHLVSALDKQDPLVTEIFLEAATYFGIGLANILNILHPEKVILGGPLITNLDLYYETAIKVAKNKTYYYPTYQPQFLKSKLGENGIGIGAAAMMIGELYL